VRAISQNAATLDTVRIPPAWPLASVQLLAALGTCARLTNFLLSGAPHGQHEAAFNAVTFDFAKSCPAITDLFITNYGSSVAEPILSTFFGAGALLVSPRAADRGACVRVQACRCGDSRRTPWARRLLRGSRA
jgi:hypothetical protein